MQTSIPRALSALTLLSAATLAACGGSSSDPATPPTTPATPPPTSVDAPRLELLAGDDGGRARVDGAGTLARFTTILGSNVDASGNIYIAEDSPALRKVTPAGVVSTLTAGAAGYVDGAKDAARVGRPLCPVTLAADGNVYFVEWGVVAAAGPDAAMVDVPVRKLAADGSISTLARISIAVGRDQLCLAAGGGRLYAWQNQRISSIGANGALTTLAGASADGVPVPADGPGASARFAGIRQVAADGGGNLYVNDAGQVIRKVTAAGATSTLAGAYAPALSGAVTPVDGAGGVARFSQLRGLVYTSAGTLMAYDRYQSGPVTELRLRTITTAGVVSSALVQTDGELAAGPDNALYQIADNQINRLRADGGVTPLAGKARSRATPGDVDGAGAQARFSDLFIAMAADAAGNVYVADNSYPGIHMMPTGLQLRKVTPAGVVTTIVHGAKVWAVAGLLADAAGNIYVGTYDANGGASGNQGGLVYKIAPDGATTVLAGAMPSTARQDGVGAAARFIRPRLAGIDGEGNLYASDLDNAGVAAYRKITPAGVVSTIAALPAGLGEVKDDAGNRYSIDSQQGTVVRTTAAGATSVAAGTPGENYTYAGALPGHLESPSLLVKTGPYSFAVTSGGAVMRLVVPR